ncbi:MAG: hypothetical protein ABIN67_15645 [Ferruginibacter sp.]
MSTIELRKLLIEKIQVIDDDKLLEEAYRLLEVDIEEPADVYILNDQQKGAIDQAREQIRQGQFLTDEESNREIDEWLNK